MTANNPFQHWSRSSAYCSIKYGCTKQLISQAVENVQIMDWEEEKRAGNDTGNPWYEKKESGALDKERT